MFAVQLPRMSCYDCSSITNNKLYILHINLQIAANDLRSTLKHSPQLNTLETMSKQCTKTFSRARFPERFETSNKRVTKAGIPELQGLNHVHTAKT
eukprot:147834-Amphidinium_carterae.1